MTTHEQVNYGHAVYLTGALASAEVGRTNLGTAPAPAPKIVRAYYDPQQARATDGKWTAGSSAIHHGKQATAASAAGVKHDAHRHALAQAAAMAVMASKSGGSPNTHLIEMNARVRKMQSQAYAARQSAMTGNGSVKDADERMAAYHHYRLLNRAMKAAHRLGKPDKMEELAQLASEATRPGAIQIKEGTAQAKAIEMEKAGMHYQAAKALKAHLRAHPGDKDAEHAWAAHAALHAHHKAVAKGGEDAPSLDLAKAHAGKIGAKPAPEVAAHLGGLHTAGVLAKPKAAAAKLPWYEKALALGKTADAGGLYDLHDKIRNSIHGAVSNPDHKDTKAADHLWAAHTNARSALAILHGSHLMDEGKLSPSNAEHVGKLHTALGEQIAALKGMKKLPPALKSHVKLLEQTHGRIAGMLGHMPDTTPSTGQSEAPPATPAAPAPETALGKKHREIAQKGKDITGHEALADFHDKLAAGDRLGANQAAAMAVAHAGNSVAEKPLKDGVAEAGRLHPHEPIMQLKQAFGTINKLPKNETQSTLVKAAQASAQSLMADDPAEAHKRSTAALAHLAGINSATLSPEEKKVHADLSKAVNNTHALHSGSLGASPAATAPKAAPKPAAAPTVPGNLNAGQLAERHKNWAAQAKGFQDEDNSKYDKASSALNMGAAAAVHGHLAKAYDAMHGGDHKAALGHFWNAAMQSSQIVQKAASGRKPMLKGTVAGLDHMAQQLKGNPAVAHMIALKESNKRVDDQSFTETQGKAGTFPSSNLYHAQLNLSHVHHNLMHAHHFLETGDVAMAEKAHGQARTHLERANSYAAGAIAAGHVMSPEHTASMKMAEQSHAALTTALGQTAKPYEKAITPDMGHGAIAELHEAVIKKHGSMGGIGGVHQQLKHAHEHADYLDGSDESDKPHSLAMLGSHTRRAAKALGELKDAGATDHAPVAHAQAEESLKVAQQAYEKHLGAAHAEMKDQLAQGAQSLAGQDIAGQDKLGEMHAHLAPTAKLDKLRGYDPLTDAAVGLRQAAGHANATWGSIKAKNDSVSAAGEHERARMAFERAEASGAAQHTPEHHALLKRTLEAQGQEIKGQTATDAQRHGQDVARASARATAERNPYHEKQNPGHGDLSSAIGTIKAAYGTIEGGAARNSADLRKQVEGAVKLLQGAKASAGDGAANLSAGGMTLQQAAEHVARLQDHREGKIKLGDPVNHPKAEAAAPTAPAAGGDGSTVDDLHAAFASKGKATAGGGKAQVTGTAQGGHVADLFHPTSTGAVKLDQLAPRLHSAMQAISSVHGITGVKPIQLRAAVASTGAYGHYAANGVDGQPEEIYMNAKNAGPELTLAHEVGHWLDRRAFPHTKPGGPGGKFKIEGSGFTADHPDLAQLKDAIMGSGAVKRLHALQTVPHVTTPAGVKVPVSSKHAKYLGRRSEIFARAYAQYIATRSGHPEMNAKVAKLRADPIYGDQKWSDEEFKPIAAAFDQVFKNKGWMK